MSDTTPRFPTRRLLATPAGKVGMILVLLLVLLIPLGMVAGLVNEREARQAQTLVDFKRGWGPDQTVAGPLLIVPYRWTDPDHKADNAPASGNTGYLRIPASRLSVQVQLDAQTRRRGLFHAAIYTAVVTMRGTIRIPDFAGAAPGSPAYLGTIDWQQGRLVLGASDLRGMPLDTRLTWNGTSVAVAGAEQQSACSLSLLQAAASLAKPKPGDAFAFETTLRLHGVQEFHVQPAGSDVGIDIASTWATPSYIGASLPSAETSDKGGFSAHWSVTGAAETPFWLHRSWALPDCTEPSDQAFFNADQAVGVALQEAVPTYQMVDRAHKYGVLFLALSFLTLFLFEALAKIRIHVVQYGLLGLSVSLFALLLISVAEPLGFAAGYAISTSAVLMQASFYTLSVTRRRYLAGIFAGVLGSLFGFLYVVLSLDAYALLAGTVALFAILSVVMVVTRRVDWNDAAGAA